jgi:hypothetical protein
MWGAIILSSNKDKGYLDKKYSQLHLLGFSRKAEPMGNKINNRG